MSAALLIPSPHAENSGTGVVVIWMASLEVVFSCSDSVLLVVRSSATVEVVVVSSAEIMVVPSDGGGTKSPEH